MRIEGFNRYLTSTFAVSRTAPTRKIGWHLHATEDGGKGSRNEAEAEEAEGVEDAIERPTRRALGPEANCLARFQGVRSIKARAAAAAMTTLVQATPTKTSVSDSLSLAHTHARGDRN